VLPSLLLPGFPYLLLERVCSRLMTIVGKEWSLLC
jgi:hypothetical protein